jgi:hypothetical protein
MQEQTVSCCPTFTIRVVRKSCKGGGGRWLTCGGRGGHIPFRATLRISDITVLETSIRQDTSALKEVPGPSRVCSDTLSHTEH